jgi:hypothetical protein
MYFKPVYKLCDWVDKNKLFIRELSNNPKSIDYFKQNTELITWKDLSANENAMEILENNFDKIDWNVIYSNKNAVYLLKKHILENNIVLNTSQWNNLSTNTNCMKIFNMPELKKKEYCKNYFLLSKNPDVISLLCENYSKIEWGYLSSNPKAIELLKNNMSKIVWDQFSKNPNLEAIELLKKNISKINWWSLNNNPNGHMILKDYQDKINWALFCCYSNDLTLCYENLDKVDWFYLSTRPEAIHVIEQHLDKINWKALTWNKNTGHIIQNNLDKIEDHWYFLSKNPCIFTYDYEQMKINNMEFAEELMAFIYHPNRVFKYMETYSYNLLEDCYDDFF